MVPPLDFGASDMCARFMLIIFFLILVIYPYKTQHSGSVQVQRKRTVHFASQQIRQKPEAWCDELMQTPIWASNSHETRETCKRLQQFCQENTIYIKENHPLLIASLWRQCIGETPVTNMEFLLDKAVANSSSHRVSLECSQTDPFAILKKPASVSKTSVLVVQACDLCTMLRANRQGIQRKFILHRFHSLNAHIDGGKRGHYNFGALSSGYDHSCHSTTEGRTYVRGCAIAYELATHCPEKSFADIIQFLDDTYLVAFLVSQDVFMYRHTLGEKLKPHPKVLTLPLGVNFRHTENWGHGGIFFRHFATLLMEKKFSRNMTMIARDSMAYQRRAIHAQLHGILGSDFLFSNNKDKSPYLYLNDIANTRFILSPPGWGSDCYRHWEALLSGAVPLIRETSISINGGMAHTVAVAYADYSMLSKIRLRQIWKKITQTRPRDLLDTIAPAYQTFWIDLLVETLKKGEIPIKLRNHTTHSLYFSIAGRKCGPHTFDAAVSLLENSPQLTSNTLDTKFNVTREYCECPCQCGLCERNAIQRSWDDLDNIEGFGKVPGRSPNMIRDAYSGKGRAKFLGATGGDRYHSVRCPVTQSVNNTSNGTMDKCTP